MDTSSAVGFTALSHEEVALTNQVEVRWLQSAEGKATLSEVNKMNQTIALLVTPLANKPLSWQDRSGIGDCKELEWTFEHWHCLHVYSDAIQRVKIDKGNLTFVTHDENMLETFVKLLNTLDETTAFVRDGDVQALRKEIWNFLDALKTNESVAMPAVGIGKVKYQPVAAGEIIISTALEFFLDHPECKTTLSIHIPPENVEMFEAFTNVLHTMEVGARQGLEKRSAMSVTFLGTEVSVKKSAKRFKNEKGFAIVSADWTDSPLSDGIPLLTTEEIVELEKLATEHNTDIYISKPEKVIRLLGLRSDVKKLRGVIDRGLFTRLSQSLTCEHTDLPDYWDKDSGEVILDSSMQEYQKVVDELSQFVTGHHNVNIIKITRIQNSELHRQYEAQKVKVIQSLGDEIDRFPAERMLWYGANTIDARQICDQEFNRSDEGKLTFTGTLYGQGIHFDVNPCPALNQNLGCLLLAKVLTGRYCKGKVRTRRANLNLTEHSTVDNHINPQTFVVYHDASAYPEYLIEYEAK